MPCPSVRTSVGSVLWVCRPPVEIGGRGTRPRPALQGSWDTAPPTGATFTFMGHIILFRVASIMGAIPMMAGTDAMADRGETLGTPVRMIPMPTSVAESVRRRSSKLAGMQASVWLSNTISTITPTICPCCLRCPICSLILGEMVQLKVATTVLSDKIGTKMSENREYLLLFLELSRNLS